MPIEKEEMCKYDECLGDGINMYGEKCLCKKEEEAEKKGEELLANEKENV